MVIVERKSGSTSSLEITGLPDLYCNPLTETFVPVLINIMCDSGRSATHRVRVGVDALVIDHMFQCTGSVVEGFTCHWTLAISYIDKL